MESIRNALGLGVTGISSLKGRQLEKPGGKFTQI